MTTKTIMNNSSSGSNDNNNYNNSNTTTMMSITNDHNCNDHDVTMATVTT